VAPFRLNISRRGEAHVAESEAGAVLGVAASAEAAAEKARLALLDALQPNSRPEMLLLRVQQPGIVIIVMQPFEKRVRLSRTSQESLPQR
jgi:hypothetical protein